MRRIPEPELMSDAEQAQAYAAADFSEPHGRFITLLRERLADLPSRGIAVDLGCGPGDITLRFAREFALWSIDGVDGSAAMLDAGRAVIDHARLGSRIRVHQLLLPAPPPRAARYDLTISNSLLHHLASPEVLWATIRQWTSERGAVFVMDLLRPPTVADARALVDTYAASEPAVLKTDFYNSLLAAYRPDEVRSQLATAGLGELSVEVVSDRHLIVFGRLD